MRGVWRALDGVDAETPPPYTRDWAEATGRGDAARSALRVTSIEFRAGARAGDVLVFRLRRGAVAKHAGNRQHADLTIVHAMDGAPGCRGAR